MNSEYFNYFNILNHLTLKTIMSNILRRAFVTRQEFDPTNIEHIASLKCFVSTGNWGEMQFFAELPFIEVPTTVLMKYVQHQLGVSLETASERNTRLASLNLKRETYMTTAQNAKIAASRLENSNMLIKKMVNSTLIKMQ
jgi:hypothetical protein